MGIVLGLNAYHADSSACIVRDGKLVAAAEEERFRRIKHWAGFPSQSIAYCLQEAGLRLADVDHVAVNRDPYAHRWRKLGFALRNRVNPSYVWSRIKRRKKWLSLGEEFANAFPQEPFKARTHNIEHHLAHLASAFLVSPYREAVAVSVDGSGDFASTCWGFGSDTTIEIHGRVFFPHSLGIFYEAITQFLGFPHYGDEYKVMGLAPYGAPRFLDALRKVVILQNNGTFRLNLTYFNHQKGQAVHTWGSKGSKVHQIFDSSLEELLGPRREPDAPMEARHKDIARSVQAMYEEAFFHLLEHVHKKTPCDTIVLAGGCAYNSVANGKIHLRSPFKHSYIQSASGDAGGAIGAAFTVWHRLGEMKRSFEMDHAFWGPSFPDAEIAQLIARHRVELERENCAISRSDDEDEICRATAMAISHGKVVGWFQGRMEWGPRALGARSIVCDPRRADMKDILNSKIKRRESFRPFAPSIVREAVPDWFESDDDVPFMMKVFQIRAERRAQIPAVTHVDGSGRLQTVTRSANARYYRLIECFRDITGVPIVLNTSFNENEPVVCRPEEALACFMRTKMDMLVLGNYMILRSTKNAQTEQSNTEIAALPSLKQSSTAN
jgi:carbamoyltransferase